MHRGLLSSKPGIKVHPDLSSGQAEVRGHRSHLHNSLTPQTIKADQQVMLGFTKTSRFPKFCVTILGAKKIKALKFTSTGSKCYHFANKGLPVILKQLAKSVLSVCFFSCLETQHSCIKGCVEAGVDSLEACVSVTP